MEKDNPDSPKNGTMIAPKNLQAMKSPPAEILPYLFLGNAIHGANKKMLKELGVTRILNVKESYGLPPANPDFEVLHMPMSDYGNQDLRELMDQCVDFIEQTKVKKEKILVHCRLGVNRSTTIVLAYLMLREHWILKRAWDHVKALRSQALPQQGYWEQLINLEKTLFAQESMSLDEVLPLLEEFARQAQRARGGLLRLPGGAESGQQGGPLTSQETEPVSQPPPRPPSPRETHPVQRHPTAPSNLNTYAANTMTQSSSSESVKSGLGKSKKEKKEKKDKSGKEKEKKIKKEKEKKEKLDKSKEKKEKEKKKKEKKSESKKRKESEPSFGDEKEGIFQKPQLKRIRTSSSLGGE